MSDHTYIRDKIYQVVRDNTGNAVAGVSVEVRKRGAYAEGSSVGTSPLTVTVDSEGAIKPADTVRIGTGATDYTVDSVTPASTAGGSLVKAKIVLSWIGGGSRTINDLERLTPTTNLPVLSADDIGENPRVNPMVTDANGVVEGYVKRGYYDLYLSGGNPLAITPKLITDIGAGLAVDHLYINVKDFGAEGDGVTDDTAAIQAAIDAAYKQGSGGATGGQRRGFAEVIVPPGRYVVTSTINWHSGVSIRGVGTGVETGSTFLPTFWWKGAAGGTILLHQTTGGNIIMHGLSRLMILGLGEGLGDQPGCGIKITDRMDWGFFMDEVYVLHINGNGIEIDKGATNACFTRMRFDTCTGGYAIYMNLNTANLQWFKLSDFTCVNGNATNMKGLLHLDGATAANDVVNRIQIDNGSIETNTNLDPTDKAWILAEVNPAISNVVQHMINIQNVTNYQGGGLNLHDLVKQKGAVTKDQIAVSAINCHTAGNIVGGLVNTEAMPVGGGSGLIQPFVVAAPFQHSQGSPAGSHCKIVFRTDIDMSGCLTHQAPRLLTDEILPPVGKSNTFLTNSAAPQTIVDFDYNAESTTEVEGHRILLIGADGGNTTIRHLAGIIELNGSGNRTLADGHTMELINYNGCWYEIPRSS